MTAPTYYCSNGQQRIFWKIQELPAGWPIKYQPKIVSQRLQLSSSKKKPHLHEWRTTCNDVLSHFGSKGHG